MKLIYLFFLCSIIQPSNLLKSNLNICRSYSLPSIHPTNFYKNKINNNYLMKYNNNDNNDDNDNNKLIINITILLLVSLKIIIHLTKLLYIT